MNLTRSLGNRWLNLLGGFVFVGLGVLFFIDLNKAFRRLGMVLGILLILLSVGRIILHIATRKREDGGVLQLVLNCIILAFGVVLLTSGAFLKVAMLTLFGVWGLVIGVVKLIVAYEYRRDEVRGWYVPLIAAGLSIAFGIFALLGTAVAEHLAAILTGIYLCTYGVYGFTEFFLSRNIQKP